ncbi:MAG: dihydroorotate dehydrogenase-like protein [Bacteroidetes bacterium]|nr:dihydroorotate dehydrogenase-like protein [Bacteroidota bacterium]
MVDLSTSYMGLTLKNPIIVGSSGLTNSPDKIKEFEEKGAGAVVLKSIFEEQIRFDIHKTLEFEDTYNLSQEAFDYVKSTMKDNSVSHYMNLIREVKKNVSIPAIASINCFTMSEWISIAKDIEKAGADGLELNVFIMPGKLDISGAEHEKMYFEIIENIKKTVKIPVALKTGYYFSNIVHTLKQFSWRGIQALVLFNRFFTPDINLETMKLQVANVFSKPEEQYIPLRWIAMIAGDVRCDISASTGIHDAPAVIRQLLAGATTTQLCSTLYLHGADQIRIILEGLTQWMEAHKFNQISAFRGKMSVKAHENPVLYHRVQYLKHLSGME